MTQVKKIKFIDFLSIFARSFFLQAVWNYQGLLAIGFCYSLVPVARRLFDTKEERISFLSRHLNFFNAHPYFSSFALGAITRIEEDLVLESKKDYSSVDRFKNALIGPLGAIGDQLIWATLKPASILIGMLGVVIINDFKTRILFLLILLLMYNIPHLYIRMFGILEGYRQGFNIYRLLSIANYRVVKNLYGGIGATSLGLLVGICLVEYSDISLVQPLIFVGSIFLAYYYKKWRQSFYESILVPLAIILILAVIAESI